jgi:hypothetical protein
MGELIAALTEAAFEVYENEKASYLVTSLALEEILKNICAPLACRRGRAIPLDKLRIRTALALWWAVILISFATYYLWL